MDYRIEHDSMGEMKVPADKYWGAQTQRSYQNFRIGTEKMPKEIITAFAYLKKAAALANFRLGKLEEEKLNAINSAADEILATPTCPSVPQSANTVLPPAWRFCLVTCI